MKSFTSSLIVLCLFSLTLFLNGCEGTNETMSETGSSSNAGEQIVPPTLTPVEQANIDEFIESTKTPPTLTPIEQREAEQYIEMYGRAVIPHYVKDYLTKEEMRRNIGEGRVLEYLKFFVAQGANISAQDDETWTIFDMIVHCFMRERLPEGLGYTDAINITKFLVSQGIVDVNSSPYVSGVTLLHIAAEIGDVEFVKFLVSQGADVNTKRDNGVTLLHTAVLSAGNVELVKFLVSQGADVNAKTTEDIPGFTAGGTPFDIAKKGIKLFADSEEPEARETLRQLTEIEAYLSSLK